MDSSSTDTDSDDDYSDLDLNFDQISLAPSLLPSNVVCTRQCGKLTITVVKDNIENQQVDVIVNATAPSLNLKDGVASRALVEKGGDAIQQDIRTKYPNGIKENEIAVSEAGSLSCKQIYHVTLPALRRSHRGVHGSAKVKKYVIDLLNEANKSGHTSIAFPGLGTGKLRYDPRKVAPAMYDAVENHQALNPATSVQDVYFVIFPKNTETLEAFKTCQPRKVDTSPQTVCKKQIGPVTIELATGNLADQNTDVILTTGTRGLDLTRGTLSKCLLDRAGPSLQTECKSKYPNGIQHGQIAVLAPGNLSCKLVYIGAIPRQDKSTDGAQGHEEIMNTLVKAVLQQACTDGMATISMPTLGTGWLMYPPTTSARYIEKAITEFVQANANCSVKTVRIVVNNLTETILKVLRPFEIELSTKKRPRTPKNMVRFVNTPNRNTSEFCLHMYQKEISPPKYWTKFTSDKTVKAWKVARKGQDTCILVDVDIETFKAVEKLVADTWEGDKLGNGVDAKGLSALGYKKLQVTKVERVENLQLLESYGNKRQTLFHDAGQGGPFQPFSKVIKHGQTNVGRFLKSAWANSLFYELNETYLFHGTKGRFVGPVCHQGLDPRMAAGHAVYGQAVYMAESPTKADQYTDEFNNRQKKGLKMFLLRCCMGEIYKTNGVRKLRRTPCQVSACMSDTCSHDKRFNSLVSEDKYIFREFVVYESQQVYPEYVITYDRV